VRLANFNGKAQAVQLAAQRLSRLKTMRLDLSTFWPLLAHFNTWIGPGTALHDMRCQGSSLGNNGETVDLSLRSEFSGDAVAFARNSGRPSSGVFSDKQPPYSVANWRLPYYLDSEC
jgi:hypothetical protein